MSKPCSNETLFIQTVGGPGSGCGLLTLLYSAENFTWFCSLWCVRTWGPYAMGKTNVPLHEQKRYSAVLHPFLQAHRPVCPLCWLCSPPSLLVPHTAAGSHSTSLLQSFIRDADPDRSFPTSSVWWTHICTSAWRLGISACVKSSDGTNHSGHCVCF